MNKIMCVFGTRPEAIKMAPIILEIKKQNKECIVVSTGQHKEMLNQVLTIFKITPNYDLHIMEPNQNLFTITSKILLSIKDIIEKEKPELILVHGDTTTAFTSALAAYYTKTPIGHVEAGLRTFDKYNPFPEEINRQLIDKLANYFFCPTKENEQNLNLENIKTNIYVTGNTGIDAIHFISQLNLPYENLVLKDIDFSQKTILLTCHRREILGQQMESVFKGILKVVKKHNIQVVYPVHLNPVVQETARKILGNNNHVHLINPLNYTDMVRLMKECYLIATDSGGLQEEGPTFHKPVLVLRNETERQEGVVSGTLKLVGTNEDDIFNEVSKLVTDQNEYDKMASSINPYGDGFSSKKIIEAINKI